LGGYKEAEELYQRAAAQAPAAERPTRQLLLAAFYGRTGRLDEAMKILNRLWVVTPNPERVAEVMVAILQSTKSPTPALLEMAALLDTREVIRMLMGDLKEAREDLDASIADKPNGSRYFHLAQLEHKAGRRGKAIDTLRMARDDFKLTRDNLHPLERPSFDK